MQTDRKDWSDIFQNCEGNQVTIIVISLLKANTLRKSLQTTSTSPCCIYVTDFVSSIHNLKAVL